MTREEWKGAQPLLTRALFLSPEQQRAVVESAFQSEGLRRELLDVLRRTSPVMALACLTPSGSGSPDSSAEIAGAGVGGSPAAPEAPILSPGQALGGDDRFVVVKQLGRGGMGEVYLAHDRTLGNLVALKVLYEVELREAQHARAASGHPHIVTMYDALTAELGGRSRTVLVLEYIVGKPASHIVDDGPIPLRTAVRWAREIASAMAHAHDRGVLHCDLKPANVLMTAEDGAKVLDFGIGRATFERPNPLERLRGTLPYMAPEQLRDRQFSQAGDVYSLGVTLFEMVTGRLPFEGSTPEVMLQIVGAEAPRASTIRTDVPAILDEVVARALAKDPEVRYRTARALDRALDEVERELATQTSPVPAPLIAPIPPAPRKIMEYGAYTIQLLAVGASSGLLTTWLFNVTIDLPGGFDRTSIFRRVLLGFQALLLPAAILSGALGATAAIRLVAHVLLGRGPLSRVAAGAQAAIGAAKTEATTFLALMVIAAGVTELSFLLVRFDDIITAAFLTRVSFAEPVTYAALRPENLDRQVGYRLTVLLLLTLFIIAWRGVKQFAAAQRSHVPPGTQAAAFGVMGLLFILCQAPYKVLTDHGDVPVVMIGGTRCYLLGQDDSAMRVFCPGWEPPRVRTIEASTVQIRHCGFEENVFAAYTASSCVQPAPPAPRTE